MFPIFLLVGGAAVLVLGALAMSDESPLSSLIPKARNLMAYAADHSRIPLLLKMPDWRPPLPLPLRVTSRILRRSGEWHGAVDLGAEVGTPVFAVEDGTISWTTTEHPQAGISVTVRGATSGLHATYCHLEAHSDRIAALVSAGKAQRAPVKAGEVLGWVGMTGHTFGPHLHLSFGLYSDPGKGVVDPLDVLPDTFFA